MIVVLKHKHNLKLKLTEEFIAVTVVCAIFLFHLRSALVAVISLPIAVGIAFVVMHGQGLNANILSLAGIALACGPHINLPMVPPPMAEQ